MKKKVVVIGSGPGGAATAALLRKKGHAVTLIESQPFTGGRCASFSKGGFTYDFGVHMFSRGNSGPHGEVNRMLEGGLRWKTHEPAARVMGKVEFDFPLDIRSFLTQVKVAMKLNVKPSCYLGAFRLFRALLKGESIERHDGTTVETFVDSYTDDDRIHLFINCLCQLYFALSYKESSAGEFMWCFSRMFNEASFGYPFGASKAIPDSFLERFEQAGGILKIHEQVTRIEIEKGEVRGVRTEKGFYPAEVVVSSAGALPTILLSGKEHFPETYTTSIEQKKGSNAYITLKYALDKKVVPYPTVFYMPNLPGRDAFQYIEDKTVPDDVYIFMPVPSNQDPSLAPPGTQLVIAGTAAPRFASAELCNAILDKIHQKVCDLFPDFSKAILWEIRSSRKETSDLTGLDNGSCIGLGQTPDQSGRFHLNSETPVAGLYLVGADAGSRGIGTELAVGSALNLVRRL